MDSESDLDQYLAHKRMQRREMFADAASTSLLMHGVKFLCMHFYHLLDLYCRLFLTSVLRHEAIRNKGSEPDLQADARRKVLSKAYADAIDTYHTLWVIITFLCYWLGWRLYQNEGNTNAEYLLWILPLFLCVYRIFEIFAAMIEMYFRESESRHHQFRILVHAGLHYLSTAFAFALFYVAADWFLESFYTKDSGVYESQFYEMFDPAYYSLLTVLYMGGNEVPQDWVGKMLTLVEIFIGFVLVTFIFLNITQVWYGERKSSI